MKDKDNPNRLSKDQKAQVHFGRKPGARLPRAFPQWRKRGDWGLWMVKGEEPRGERWGIGWEFWKVMSFTLPPCISFSCVAPSSPVTTDLVLHSHHDGTEEAEETPVVPLWDGDHSNGEASHKSAMILDWCSASRSGSGIMLFFYSVLDCHLISPGHEVGKKVRLLSRDGVKA